MSSGERASRYKPMPALSTPLAIIDSEMNEVASLQSKVEVWGNGGLTDQLQGLSA